LDLGYLVSLCVNVRKGTIGKKSIFLPSVSHGVCEFMVNDNYASNAVHTWQYSVLSGSLIMLTKQVGPSSNDSDLYLTATHFDSQLGYWISLCVWKSSLVSWGKCWVGNLQSFQPH